MEEKIDGKFKNNIWNWNYFLIKRTLFFIDHWKRNNGINYSNGQWKLYGLQSSLNFEFLEDFKVYLIISLKWPPVKLKNSS